MSTEEFQRECATEGKPGEVGPTQFQAVHETGQTIGVVRHPEPRRRV